VLDVERLKAEVGDTVDLGVLMLGGNGETQVGTPERAGAKVVAEVVEHGRDKKVLVFKYKNKTRYRRRHGHRQGFTRLSIKEIVTEGGTAETATAKPKRARKAPAKPKKKEEPAEAAVEATAEVAEAPAEEKPKRATRKAPAKKAAGEKKAAAKPRARKAAPKAETDDAEKPTKEAPAEDKPAGDAETEE
jgi:large subunit ribosomal protein L21